MQKIKLFLATVSLFLACAVAGAQNIRVSGTVKTSEGEPLPGAAVVVKGTTVGVNTDLDGKYTLSVPSNATLVASMIGYVESEVEVNSRATIDFFLHEDSELLDDVLVVAYGTASKSSFTGSAAMVKEETIEKKIATNVTSALAGTTSGVQMISSSGDPTGNSSAIRIRGFGSMSASNAPLIILDGVPYQGSISDINPQDVESMSVLKDASASAIYGHRGANGVVIITTKRGKSGDATVKFDAKWGANSRLVPQYDVISDPGEYYETFYRMLYNKYYYSGYSETQAYAMADKNLLDSGNGGLGYLVYTLPEGEKLIGTNFKLNPNAVLGYTDGTYTYIPDDWYNEVYHTGFRQEYNASVSGASERFNYYGSVGFLQDGGMVANSDYKRYTGRINTEYQVKDWFRVETNMSFSHSDSQLASYTSDKFGSSGNVFYVTNTMGPIYPLYVRDAEGHIMKENGRTVYDSNNTNFKRPSIVGNAVRDNEYNDYNVYADVLNAKWAAIFTPVKGLTLTASLGLTDDNTRASYLYSQFAGASSTDGGVQVSHSRFFSVNQQYLAQYRKTFGLNSIDVLAGFESYKYKSQSLSGYNDHLFNPYVGELNNADGTSAKLANSATGTYMTEGFLARAQYEYDGRYFLNASYRRDASSKFAKGHRWGNFGSVGAAWLITKEEFMGGVSWLDVLKLKISYGVQGNDGIDGLYPYSDQYTHSYNEETGSYSVNLEYKGNEELTWETSKSFNVGLDFELFHGYLNGAFEVFSRKTEDLLYNKSVPLSAGNPTGFVPVNVGSIRNSGFEVSLDGLIINRKNFNWSWNLNASHYKNTILELDETVAKNGIKGGNYIYKIGGSLYEGYMRKYAGVDRETGQALYYYDYEDENGNTVTGTTANFSKASQYEIGTVLPKLYGGFGTSLNFYNFDLSAQFSYQLGGRYYDGTYQSMMFTQANAGANMHRDLLKAWTPENPDSDFPRLDGDTQVAQTAVDRFLVSSNYLSINNVTFGYTFPSAFVRKIKLQSLRVYVAGENLALFTARKGVDPRYSVGLGSYTSGSGLNSGGYSAMRNITGGVTITF